MKRILKSRWFWIGALCAMIWGTAHAQTLAPHGQRFVSAPKLAALKTLAVPTNPRWVALKKAADGAVAVPALGNCPNLGLAYLVTRDAKYGNAAITAAMGAASQPVGSTVVSGDSWYNMRNNYMAVVRTYEWCYPLLTNTQKTAIATWLIDNASACWARPGGWAITNAENNYFYGFCYTGMAGLAVFGDEPRAQAEIDRWLTKLNNSTIPVLGGNTRGGQWIESTSYALYDANMLAVQLDAYQTATGISLLATPAVSAYLRDVCTFALQSTTPDLVYRWPFGDQSRSSMPGIMEYDRDAVLLSASLSGAQSDIKQWLTITKQPSMAVRAWSEFLYYPEGVAATDYRTTQPNSYFVPGAGTFFFRQNWGASATMWSAWAGPMSESHQFPECGGLQIFKGAWLLPMAPIYSQSGIVGSLSGGNPDTRPFNAVTVAGHPQTQFGFTSGVKGGQTITHEVGTDYVVWEGQSAPCYYYRDATKKVVRSATDVDRRVIYLPGADIFAVFDRVTKVLPAETTGVHWHSQKSPTIAGNRWTVDNGKYQLTGDAFGGALSSVAEPYGANGAVSTYRTDITAMGGAATDRITTVLQVTPLGANAGVPAAVKSGSYEGVQAGKWVIGFATAIGQTAYAFNGTAATEHVVSGLTPNTNYGAWGNSSTSGTLRLSLPAGINGLTLTAGAQPLPPAHPPDPVPVPIPPLAPGVNMWIKTTAPGVGGGFYLLAGSLGEVYALGRTGIAVTSDGGATWSNITDPLLVGKPHYRMVFNSLGEPVASINGARGSTPSALYRYANGQWVKGTTTPAITKGYILALAKAGNGDLVAISEQNNCYRSTDNGATWNLVAASITSGGVGYIAKTGPDGVIWAGGEWGSAGPGIFNSIDAGSTWQGQGLSNSEGWKHNLIGIAFNLLGETLAGKDGPTLGIELQHGGVWSIINGGQPKYAATMDIQVHPVTGGILLLQNPYQGSKSPQWAADGSHFVAADAGLDGALLIRALFHPLTNEAWLIDNNGAVWINAGLP